MKIVISIILIVISVKSNCQIAKDSSLYRGNDSYDNFNNSRVSDSLPFFIYDKEGSKIIYQRTFRGKICKECYEDLILIAEKYKKDKLCEDAVRIYKIAFRLNGNLGKVKDRYNTAICYSKLGQNDSAFIQLDKIANGGKYNYLDEINTENAFKNLHGDARWKIIIDLVKKNLKEYGDKLNSNIEGYEIKNN